jgi:cystathionine beta-lyase
MDFSSLGLSDQELDRLIVGKAKLWLDPGPMFGPGGSGFQRLNMACPRSVLREALDRLAAALPS